ncbi:MAG TPA: glycosyltransferase family 4 protein [Vicinamibacterales bacterium]|nr:glycosyltransferase family 4 protein [Vicinamibacterales bacterium]
MQPRVLIITTYYYPVVGGVETHARQLVRYLCAAGFPTGVVTKRVLSEDAREDVVDNVPVHRVGPPGDRHGSGKWIALPFMLVKLLQLRDRFDILVCIDYRGIGIAAVLVGGLLRRPVMVQSGTAGVLAAPRAESGSGVPAESAFTRLLKWPARLIYRRADHFVCIGRDIEQEALDAGVPRQRVHYLPHGVDLRRFRPAANAERAALRAAVGWPVDRVVVLFVGRLSIEKGIVDLVEAWRSVKDDRALLVIVGPDMPAHPWDAGPRIKTLIEQNDLKGRVRLSGASDDTAPLYRAADVFVQPSHFEGFGISAIEAMASGLPVVAARVGGLRDFLVDGENALLHEPRSPASIAQALARLLSDVSERSRLAAAGLRTVRQRFDERDVLVNYASLITSAARPGTKDQGRTKDQGPGTKD